MIKTYILLLILGMPKTFALPLKKTNSDFILFNYHQERKQYDMFIIVYATF